MVWPRFEGTDLISNGKITELDARAVREAVDSKVERFKLQHRTTVCGAKADELKGVKVCEGSEHLDKHMLLMPLLK